MDPYLYPTHKAPKPVHCDVLDLFAQPPEPAPAPAPPHELTLDERFEAFHAANPHVYAALEGKARQLLQAGEHRIGIALLVEEIRRDGEMTTTGDPWKVNNSWRAFYARLLIERVPGLGEVMELRQQKRGAA